MLTRKRNALNHLCEDITHVGGIARLHAGACEALYALSSRIKRSAIDEVVAMQNTKSLEAPLRFPFYIASRVDSPTVLEKGRMGSIVLAQSSARSTSLTLESVMFEIESREDGRVNRNDDDMSAWKLCEMLKNDGYRVFV